MKLTIELSVGVVASIQEYLATQVRPQNDPLTGAAVLKRQFESIEAFVESQLRNLVDSILQQFPGAPERALLEQIAGLRQRIANAANVTVTSGVDV